MQLTIEHYAGILQTQPKTDLPLTVTIFPSPDSQLIYKQWYKDATRRFTFDETLDLSSSGALLISSSCCRRSGGFSVALGLSQGPLQPQVLCPGFSLCRNPAKPSEE